MKPFLVSTLFATALIGPPVAAPSVAANVPLPAPSPKAMVMQTVGIADITVEYSSPGIKGRKIFGTLVPYGELWRTGANASTKITFSRDVSIGGKPVAAGTYAIFTLPTAKGWTFILNKNKDASTQQYDEKQDALRLEVKPERAPKRERMTFLFTNTTEMDTRLDLEWDELRISIPIKADTAAQTSAAIDGYVDTSWRPLAQAARYLSETANDPARALRTIDASLAVKETWFNLWIKAQILAKANDLKGAYPLAEKAYELGSKDGPGFFFKADVEKALADWKTKI